MVQENEWQHAFPPRADVKTEAALERYIQAHLLSLRSISSHRRTSLTNFRWNTFTSGFSYMKNKEREKKTKNMLIKCASATFGFYYHL